MLVLTILWFAALGLGVRLSRAVFVLGRSARLDGALLSLAQSNSLGVRLLLRFGRHRFFGR